MSVKFNIVERGNPSNREAPKKFYPSIQSSGRVTTREMAEMAAQRSTLSTMDMMAAIESFMAIIPEQLTKGNIVELGEFGSFWLRSTADGVMRRRSGARFADHQHYAAFHPWQTVQTHFGWDRVYKRSGDHTARRKPNLNKQTPRARASLFLSQFLFNQTNQLTIRIP